jgi:L-threonylcarbamoyladenylate synthase
MKLLTKEDILQNKSFFLDEIKKEKTFIYPTDTIYGIGCDATNNQAVSKIRTIKQRDSRPFSIIAPSENWILKNCNVTDKKFLDKLPGKYTLIFELKNKGIISEKVSNNLNTVGVRIPDHWFAKFLSEIDTPFVTTSVNNSGEPPIKQLSELPGSIKEQVDYIIDEGILDNPPSTVLNTLTGEILR